MTKSMLSPELGTVIVSSKDLAHLLRAIDGKPARVPVEIHPMACWDGPQLYLAAIKLAIEGEPWRWVVGEERFTDRMECERHAIRIANGAALAFGKCRDWDKYEFTVTVQGTRA